MTPEEKFKELLETRWTEACGAVGMCPTECLTWDIGEYAHFKTKRGFGVTFQEDDYTCHLRFAAKLLKAPEHRQDGIIRHELGHVFDILVPPAGLDAWAAGRGIFLPKTQERRADAIARAIWLTPIRYDKDEVQSTSTGTYPRPEHLGL